MSKSNVSDIDYSVFNTTTSPETPSEAPKLKSEGISKRSIVKAKAEEKPRDLTNASNPAQIAQRATDTANALPNVEVPDTLANYALPVLEAIGTGLAAYGLWKNQNKLPLGETVAGAPPEGMTQKTDLRNVQPVAETPAAPQPEFPKATTQQSALPQGYGQQTINAPTGAPVVPTAAPQPVAPTAPPAIDPIQEANIRRANALAAKAESEAAAAAHKLQKLQTPAATGPATTTKAAKETLKPGDASLVTSGGLNATANKMHQDFPLSSVDSLVKDTPVAEQQNAVAAVKQENLKNPQSSVAQAEEQGFKTYIKKAEQITGAAGSAVSPESRRTPAETAISKQEMPLNKGVNQVRAALGYYKDSPIDPKAAQAAYNTAFERGLISEKNVGVGGMNPSAAATIADISANPDLYPKEVVQHVKTMSEKYGKKPPSSSQAGFVTTQMPTELTPFGKGVAQVGKQVVGDLKMGAAAIPFALATDIRQADVGARREMVQQLKTEKDPQRIAELQGEIKKIDDGLFLQQMYKHFVEKNVPKQYRPAFSR